MNSVRSSLESFNIYATEATSILILPTCKLHNFNPHISNQLVFSFQSEKSDGVLFYDCKAAWCTKHKCVLYTGFPWQCLATVLSHEEKNSNIYMQIVHTAFPWEYCSNFWNLATSVRISRNKGLLTKKKGYYYQSYLL